MFMRGLSQTEVAARLGAHTSNISRIISGKLGLSPANRAAFARVFNCPETAFLEPIGTPIPEPEMDLAPDFNERLRAVVAVVGADQIQGYLKFLATGDYAGLPPDIMRRIREILDDEAW